MSVLPISTTKASLSRLAKGSGADTANVSSYLYGLMQCLDCCYLGANIVFAERGQAKIYELLNAFPGSTLPGRERFGQLQSSDGKPAVFLYAPTGYDIKGQPLNQSRRETRISIHEDDQSLRAKVNEMFAAPPNQPLPPNRANALLQFYRSSVFPWRETPVVIKDMRGGKREYVDYNAFLKDYEEGFLHPNDCKETLCESLHERLRRIQMQMGSCICDWVKIDESKRQFTK
jgi:tyrosyl-tRNA synthetase